MPNEKRLQMLEELTGKGEADAFAWYALAMEYQGFGRVDDALKAFRTLREKDASYVPMYLMCGTMLLSAGRTAEGREWLESGILEAKKKADTHAVSELEDALAAIPPPPSLV